MDGGKNKFGEIIRNFSPAWYASVMGTGGLANVLFALGSKLSFLRPVAVALWWLNIVLFLLFIGPWLARWIGHLDRVVTDMKHPVMSNFFVTMPVGGLVLGTNFFLMGKAYFGMSFISVLGLVLWSLDVILTLFFGIWVMYNMMLAEKIGPELTNFSWFISPVACIVLPLLGNLLVKVYAGPNINLAKFINLVDLSFLGMGLILFLILSGILISRFINHPMPHAMVTPTFWIILGPIGVGAISLMGLADSLKMLGMSTAVDTLKITAVLLWGFGLWAFPLTLVVTFKYLKGGGIPFSLSWWAFIFPLSAYTLSGFNVYSYTGVAAVNGYSVLLAVLLVVLWLNTFVKSLVGTFNGKLLISPAADKKQP